MLVDTAIVGHLGTVELASLAIAATVLATAFTIFNFLTYGTTAQVARLHGAGRDSDAAALGSQALWLGLAIGLVLLVLLEVLATPIVELMGGEGEVADGAVLYLRIAALGAPLFMLASAAQGFLRGVGDLRTPLLILVAAHIAQRDPRAAVRVRVRLGPGRLGVGHRDRAGRDGRGVLLGPVPRRARAPAPAEDAPADADRLRDRRPHHRADRLVPGRLRRARPDRRGTPRRAPDRVPAVGVPRARARRDRDRRAGDGRPDARRERRDRRARRRLADDRLVGRDRRPVRRRAARPGRPSSRSCSPATPRWSPRRTTSGRCSR